MVQWKRALAGVLEVREGGAKSDANHLSLCVRYIRLLLLRAYCKVDPSIIMSLLPQMNQDLILCLAQQRWINSKSSWRNLGGLWNAGAGKSSETASV